MKLKKHVAVFAISIVLGLPILSNAAPTENPQKNLGKVTIENNTEKGAYVPQSEINQEQEIAPGASVTVNAPLDQLKKHGIEDGATIQIGKYLPSTTGLTAGSCDTSGCGTKGGVSFKCVPDVVVFGACIPPGVCVPCQ